MNNTNNTTAPMNMEELPDVKFLEITDIFKDTKDINQTKQMNATITKVISKQTNHGEKKILELSFNFDNNKVRLYREISFIKTPLGANFEKDFLMTSGANNYVDMKEYSTEDLEGFTLSITFGLTINKFFDKQNPKSEPIHLIILENGKAL